ncbi:hypothetical protein ABMA70_01015 [Halobacteriovorax sp. XZX-3]|uniref:COG1470 family protein n=1 Tax=unclassified Halobacteriovorax TaxID=2639665 RepID=UPI0037155714
MNNKKQKLLVAAFLMTQAPAVIAGYYNSSIEGISLDGIYTPENLSNISKTVCKKVYDDPNMDKEHTQMCERGVQSAQRMAAVYAAGEGTHLGCVDGYQQGLYRGFNVTSNPSVDILRDEQRALKGVTIENAVALGKDKAAKDSRYSTESEIISRFRDNVRDDASQTVTAPSKDYSNVLKVPRFEGFDDGYARDGKGGSFSDVINAGWVSSSSAISKRIHARAVARQFGLRSSLADKCSSTPILFDKGLHTVSMWDLFSAYGEYNFKDYGWKSTTRAWNKFQASDEQEAIAYRNIQDVKEAYQQRIGYHQKSVAVEIDEIGADGQPTGRKVVKRDANGNIVYKQVDDLNRPIFETRYRTVSGKSAKDLKAVYADAFAESYRNLAKEHFGKAFVSTHTMARNLGEDSGKAVGLIVARDLAKQQAYDEVYKAQSATSFAKEYENLFVASWNKNFDYFVNNPMVEITGFDLSGDGNGIFTRGESLKSVLGLRNLGLKSGNIKVSLDSASFESGSSRSEYVTAPASLNFTHTSAKAQGKLSNNLNVFDSARLTVSIDGSDIKKVYELKSTDSKTIEILDVAPVYHAQTQINSVVAGDATVYVTVKNPSNSETSASVDISVAMNDGKTYTATTTALKAGESKRVPVRVTGVDPLFIINNGLSGKVTSKVGGRIMNTRSASFDNVNFDKSVADYFNSILTNSTTNYGDDGYKEDRVETLISIILTATEREIKTDWDNNAKVANTMIGALQKEYKASSAAGKLNEEAKETYKVLAQELEALYDSTFGYKDYINQLKVFNGDLETRSKKDRKKD